MVACLASFAAHTFPHDPAACTTPTHATPRIELKDEQLDRVEDYLELCEIFGWSGVALIAKKRRIVYQRGVGLASREAEQPNDESTVFEIASATKPFTASAILPLAEDRRIDLDASIAEYLPGVPAGKRGITVRHLLAHTSGIPRAAVGGASEDLLAAVESYLGNDSARKPGAAHEN